MSKSRYVLNLVARLDAARRESIEGKPIFHHMDAAKADLASHLGASGYLTLDEANAVWRLPAEEWAKYLDKEKPPSLDGG
jgi:hypothetical protein